MAGTRKTPGKAKATPKSTPKAKAPKQPPVVTPLIVSTPLSAISRLPADRRNRTLERISQNARRLRGGIGVAGTPDLPKVGRSDADEQALARLGVIPIVAIPHPTALTAYVQAFARDGETITVTGPTTPQTFVPGDPLRAVTFAASGIQTLTATSSVDANASGRATVSVT